MRTKLDRNALLVRMENFWDLLLKLMKHGTNTLHVAFIFLFSVNYLGLLKDNFWKSHSELIITKVWSTDLTKKRTRKRLPVEGNTKVGHRDSF